jgi:hypothetical protein
LHSYIISKNMSRVIPRTPVNKGEGKIHQHAPHTINPRYALAPVPPLAKFW